MKEDIYEENGYEDRMDYLKSLSGEYGADMMTVGGIAELLGEGEDFDALVSTLEDLPFM
jgi:hypothetical protein